MNLPQGIPALILLVLVSIVAFLLGIQLSPFRHSSRRDGLYRCSNVDIMACLLDIAPLSPHSLGVYNKESVRWFFKTSPTKFRAFVTGSTAFPFWIWAVYNVVSYDIPDVGAMTFLFVMISCVLVLFSSSCSCLYCGVNFFSDILLLSNCLMTLNYGLPVFANLPLSFKIYLASGALYWTFMSYWNWTSVSHMELVSQSREERKEEVAIAAKEYGSVV
jgi:hypothetical protein